MVFPIISIFQHDLTSQKKLLHPMYFLFKGMDIDSFVPLIDLKFNSPSLEIEDTPTFGTLLACVNISLKMVYKVNKNIYITPKFFFKLLTFSFSF